MCFYHSVAIKIETDLLEVLGLNQIANVFPEEDVSKTPLYYSLYEIVNQIVVACEKN